MKAYHMASGGNSITLEIVLACDHQIVIPVQELLTWRSTTAPAFERPYAAALSGKWGPAASFDLRASAGIGSQRLLRGGEPLATQASVAGSDAIQAVYVRLLSGSLTCSNFGLAGLRPTRCRFRQAASKTAQWLIGLFGG